MHFGDTARLQRGHSFQPARVAALATLLTSAVLVTGAGVAIGAVIQDRLEAGPSAAQREALNRIDRQPVTARESVAEQQRRGPNRADLGGGRAELGAAR